mgnify:CR=1 FL=1
MSSSYKSTNKGMLTSAEVDICKKIIELDIKLVSQRAKAILAINAGETQSQAGKDSGLTIGQIRYMMVLYKKNGIKLFPAEILKSLQKADTLVEEQPEQKTIKKKSKEKKQAPPKPKKKKKSKKEADKKVKKEKKGKKKKKK